MTRTQFSVKKKLSSYDEGFPNEKTHLINNGANLSSIQSDVRRLILTDSNKSGFTQNSSKLKNKYCKSQWIPHLILTIILGCIFVIAVVLIRTALWHSHPRVTTPLGIIEGQYKISSKGRRFEAYEGIPYGQPPIKEQRFRVPRPITSWKGVLMAKNFGPPCYRYGPIPAVRGPKDAAKDSEDCLYLNVYSAITDHRRLTGRRTDLLAVIVFIHGGAFRSGSGMQYGPDYLLNEDTILVTINYRLGPLGFLSTEDHVVPGNMGLKDQVVALRWVHDNIKSFGGDPKKVTIIGHSAGGVSVHYHYLTNITKGLFHSGISLSGTALNCWAQTENSLNKTKQLATKLGCPNSTVENMIDCLRGKSAHDITYGAADFTPWLDNPFTPFGPVVEKGGGEFTFIDKPPIEVINTGQAQDIPWITGVVSEEGLFPGAEFVANKTRLEDLNENWLEYAPHLLDYNFTIPLRDQNEISTLIRQSYLGDKAIDSDSVNHTVRMMSDRLFNYHAAEAARLQARAGNTVSFYYFSYRGTYSFSEWFSKNTQNFGVSHGDDIAYVLKSFFDATTTEQDREMQKVLIELWVSFARKSVPQVGVHWPTVNSKTDDFDYLHIAGPESLSIERTRNFGRESFWLSIGFNENILPTKTTANYSEKIVSKSTLRAWKKPKMNSRRSRRRTISKRK
ncbi:venom carboxylesterase-6-like [Diprion similis]|uniref:venom carboxylesterase-6-like n=1 Tax=Diprion similis TaxID=362088 RepID=UPI001EF767C3|nr:venom carboxylesterase-6-like [Diprion similis]